MKWMIVCGTCGQQQIISDPQENSSVPCVTCKEPIILGEIKQFEETQTNEITQHDLELMKKLGTKW